MDDITQWIVIFGLVLVVLDIVFNFVTPSYHCKHKNILTTTYPDGTETYICKSCGKKRYS